MIIEAPEGNIYAWGREEVGDILLDGDLSFRVLVNGKIRNDKIYRCKTGPQGFIEYFRVCDNGRFLFNIDEDIEVDKVRGDVCLTGEQEAFGTMEVKE